MPTPVDRLEHRGRARAAFAALFGCSRSFVAGNWRAALPAQLILVHGHSITVDRTDSIAQALAVRDGKIIAVGTDEQIIGLADRATRRIDSKGRTATPNLIDSRAHIAPTGIDASAT